MIQLPDSTTDSRSIADCLEIAVWEQALRFNNTSIQAQIQGGPGDQEKPFVGTHKRCKDGGGKRHVCVYCTIS